MNMLNLFVSLTIITLINLFCCINGKCIVKKTYYPAEYEKMWRNKIIYETDESKAWLHGCQNLKNNETLLTQWIEFSSNRQAGQNPDPTELIKSGVLSYFHTQEICDGVVVHDKNIPIEPLIGFLRHPFYHCLKGRKTEVEDKDYIIVTREDEIFPVSKVKSNSSTSYLFDVGANLYDGWQITNKWFIKGSMSTKWFVDAYNISNIGFDRILCWEANHMEPKKIYHHIPRKVLGKISYFNIPVTAEKESEKNPLTIMKDVATTEDFVVIKIDIDAPLIELPLIHEIINDPVLRELIDELYFEHHVHGSPMVHLGWGGQMSVNETLISSYEIFSKLRELGVRAHSWV